jgi:hypothetical protein
VSTVLDHYQAGPDQSSSARLPQPNHVQTASGQARGAQQVVSTVQTLLLYIAYLLMQKAGWFALWSRIT